jgi:hypothetical protein
MFIVCLERNWVNYGDCPGAENAITSLTPLASFSRRKDAVRFQKNVENAFEGHLRFEIVGGSYIPHDPDGVTGSVERAVDRYLISLRRGV